MLEVAHYPANLRDLREVVKAGYLRARGCDEICVEHLPKWVRAPLRYDRRLERAAKVRLAEWALRASGGQIGKAAERIGAHRNTVSALTAGLRGRGPVANNVARGG